MDKPRSWTDRARRRGGFLAIVAALVVFSFFWINTGLFGIIALDAISMLDPNAERWLQPVWMIVGVLTLIAFPFWVGEQVVAARARKRRGGRE